MSAHLFDDLNAGIEAMGLDVPAHLSESLIDFIGLLLHWNKAFNLTAVRDPEEMVSKHLLDSLSVLPFIGEGDVIDVGSGAGLPGIPLALAKPATRFVLNDCNGKKTRFLTQAKIALKLGNIDVINKRIEDYHPMDETGNLSFDVIIARAYASIDDILSSTSHLQGEKTRILVMQGKLDTKIGLAGYTLKEVHALDVPGLDAERHLLEIQKQH